MARPRIYQIFCRLFGNPNDANVLGGDVATNGSAKFSSVDDAALAHIAKLGCTHVWLTGVLRHATLTPHARIPADPPTIVKGRAGSPYAITDYYDVDPDLADDPMKRHGELADLIARVHHAGLKVLFDFVPNHVARSYASVVHPERDFGKDDDRQVFFRRENDFFYLTQPPGRSTHIHPPRAWQELLERTGGPKLDGSVPQEDGKDGRTPRVTGNSVVEPWLGEWDWYETVKLNYGYCFADGTYAYEPRPPLWDKMNDVIAHWQDRGVDGFRCDFAHWVPLEFWTFLLAEARKRNPDAYFLGEAYDDGAYGPLPGSPPGTTPVTLLDAGFDAVYDHVRFRASRGVAAGIMEARRLEDRPPPRHPDRFLRYVENHDERRAASPLHRGKEAGDTGYGSADVGFAHAAALFLASKGPVLVYAGQEVGEKGSKPLGFAGDDGRSSIFDYGSPDSLRELAAAKWDANALDHDRAALCDRYRRLLALAGDPLVELGGYAAIDPGSATDVVAFLRTGKRSALLVAINLSADREWLADLRIPDNVLTDAGFESDSVSAKPVHAGGPTVSLRRKALADRGFSVVLAPSGLAIFKLSDAGAPSSVRFEAP